MVQTTFKVVFPEYIGHGSYGSGGWSRNAKHRPLPVRHEIITNDVVFTTGKSVIVNDTRKLKCNIFNARTGECLREDYDTNDEMFAFGDNLRKINARNKKLAQAEAERQAQIALDRANYAAQAEARAKARLEHIEQQKMVMRKKIAEGHTFAQPLIDWVKNGKPADLLEAVILIKNSTNISIEELESMVK